MEQVTTLKFIFLSIVGTIGGAIVEALGGWGEDMNTLIIFMAVDFILGLAIAAVWKKSPKSENGALNSWSAWKGLVRKGVSLLVVLIAHRLDLMIGTDYIRTAVIIAFCTNELISIVESLGIIGLPLPKAITNAIDVLKNKADMESEGKQNERE